jgi:hypothetical protein
MDAIKNFIWPTHDPESYFVGDYLISTICLSTFPCQHSVRNQNGEWRLFSGDTIYLMLKKNNLSTEHFDKYEEFLRKQNDPVEIETRRQERINEKKMEEELTIERLKKQEHINNFKASSRLEKLHKLNAIA